MAFSLQTQVPETIVFIDFGLMRRRRQLDTLIQS
jgi:hypothetical protein